MKPIRLASLAMATAALLPSFTSCTSDPNPFDIIITPGETQNEPALIRLNLNVEATRAGELSTAEENAIRKVNIYVFNQKHELEITEKGVLLGEGENSIVIEVSHGLKTIYAITAESEIDPAKGISIEDFEKLTFASTLDKLKSDSGHMMIGKSAEQQVMISASQEDMPESNNFSIRLTRAVAKAQVKYGNLDGSSFGITLGGISFKAEQTCETMMVVHNGLDIISSFADTDDDGTFDGYTLRDEASYKTAVTSDFTAEGCEYMPENIVSQPVSGNTTFLSIKIATTPKTYYSFGTTDTTPRIMEEVPAAGSTYYVVGIVDRSHGVSDYAVDSRSHIYTFKNQEDAQRYMSSLNKGEVSAMTVSQTDAPLRAPSTRAPSTRDGETMEVDETTDDNARTQFEVFTFENGEAYYRVNIAHSENTGESSNAVNKVVRNKFYKVNINSVRSLGFSEESLLRPSNAAAVLDAQGSSWISASFTVAEWDEVNQDVDL